MKSQLKEMKMINKSVLALVFLGVFTGTSFANDVAKQQAKPANAKSVVKMTCEEFLLLDESYLPIAVGIAGGAEKHKDGIINVTEVKEITPFIVTECKQAPKASFMEKVKAKLAEWRKKM
ncbi:MULTISPECIES: HdeA/HdeB family chaperone [unclassified Serratia (in: enterobacteria)]|uniref:HdeA/HdeB family chaperone n=1 Tax=unclassified Serratia (in: enterobacteria) TaxID=2647522 RepID=UPI00307615E7